MSNHKLFSDQPQQLILTSMPHSESSSQDGHPYDQGYRSPPRKRRQRTPPPPAPRRSLPDHDQYHPSTALAIANRYNPPRSGSMSDGSFHAEQGSSRSVPGEDSLTIRRREANRLAAQRFRNRKKGYQDSLEERVRQLEEEKDAMARRLGESGAEPYVDGEDKGWQRGERPSFSHSVTPDREVDGDVRVAGLEAANRRLQDELRDVGEENERLREEVNRWRRWGQDVREKEERPYTQRQPTLPPLSMPGPSYQQAYDPSPAATSPSFRLPPIRLAPPGPSLPSPSSHYPPRAPGVDTTPPGNEEESMVRS